MAVRKPVVRHFIACERIEQSQDGRQYSLINTVHALKLLPGAAYPQILPEIALFVQMSDGLAYSDSRSSSYSLTMRRRSTCPLRLH